MKSFCRWLEAEGLVEASLIESISGPRRRQELPDVPSEGDVKKLIHMPKQGSAMVDANLPGQQLRSVREQLGMTMREVEEASKRLVAQYSNAKLEIPTSRLSDIETKGIIPSIYRLYSLAVIYGLDLGEILLLVRRQFV